MPEALEGEDEEPSKDPVSFLILAGGGFTMCLCLSAPPSFWLSSVLASLDIFSFVVDTFAYLASAIRFAT